MNLNSVAFAKCWCITRSASATKDERTALSVIESAGKQTLHWELWIQVFLWVGTQYGLYTYVCWCNFSRVFQKIHHHVLFQMIMSRTYHLSWISFLIYCFVLEVVSIFGNCLRWSWRSCTFLDVVNFGTEKDNPQNIKRAVLAFVLQCKQLTYCQLSFILCNASKINGYIFFKKWSPSGSGQVCSNVEQVQQWLWRLLWQRCIFQEQLPMASVQQSTHLLYILGINCFALHNTNVLGNWAFVKNLLVRTMNGKTWHCCGLRNSNMDLKENFNSATSGKLSVSRWWRVPACCPGVWNSVGSKVAGGKMPSCFLSVDIRTLNSGLLLHTVFVAVKLTS